MNELIIGVAIEDAHISAGPVDFDTRKVVRTAVQRKKINQSGTANEIILAWAKVLIDVANLSNAKISNIGISLPGLCDYNNGIWLMDEKDRYNSLTNCNIKELLSAQLDISPAEIRMVNDAASFLQGEVFGGAGRGFKRSLGVTLGLGLGTARYANGIAENLSLCTSPFLDGVAEDYISIKWIISRYNALSGSLVKDMMELKQLAAEDPRVGKVFDEFAENLSQFLITFVRQNNPEIVVIGGFMESFNKFFFDNLADKMVKNGIKIPILRAILGEQASIIGAASTWYESSPLHV